MPVFVIDTECLKVLKVARTAKQAAYWADILVPVRDYYMNDVAGRSLSVFTENELRHLYANTAQSEAGQRWDYGELITRVLDLIKQQGVDDTSVPELVSKLGHEIKPIDPKPAPEKAGRKPTNLLSGGGAVATKPKAGTATGRVWEIADTLYKEVGDVPNRNAVIELCIAEGINPATASTQYGKWKKALGA